MKKLIAILLIAVMALSLAACGTINQTEVAVLWSGDGVVRVPNSLINAMERAMYTQNISYAHYGANGDQATQTQQAAAAVEAGCAALVVELADPAAAQEILELAKGKNIPIIFFNCDVDEAVAAGYEKCMCVNSDPQSCGPTQGEMIGEYVVENFEDVDRNEDGQITYAVFGSTDPQAIIAAADEILAEDEKPALVFYDAENAEKLLDPSDAAGQIVSMMAEYNDDNSNTVELIITDSDLVALEVLVALQSVGFNENKLTTHRIPLFTVNADADYKSYVLAERPEGTREDEAVRAFYEEKQYLVDFTNVKDEDLEEMVYNTYNVIDDGRILGTATEDYDALAKAVAVLTRNLLKGNEAVKGIDEEQIVSSWLISVPYTTYTTD